MSNAPGSPRELQFHYVLDCPCGTTLSGRSEDEIVEVAFAHLREKHPDMADDYEREHILVMARRLVRG
jgi:predicted small metal-binding protein